MNTTDRKEAHRNKMQYKREQRAKVRGDVDPVVLANLSVRHPLRRTENALLPRGATIAEHHAYRSALDDGSAK